MVSEMPLFLLPGVGETLGPPDPVAVEWRERIGQWRTSARGGAAAAVINAEAHQAGLRPMPIRDQMTLQWMMIRGGLTAGENIE